MVLFLLLFIHQPLLSSKLNMLAFDLVYNFGKNCNDLKRLVALLLHASRFESAEQELTYSEITARLGWQRRSNIPQFIGRLLKQSKDVLPPAWYRLGRRSRKRTLGINPTVPVRYTACYVPLSSELLQQEGDFSATGMALTNFTYAEAPWFSAIHAVGLSELGFRNGNHPKALKEIHAAAVTLGGDMPDRMTALVLLYRLRSNRRMENWPELKRLTKTGEDKLKEGRVLGEGREIIQGILILYKAWEQYDHIGAGGSNAYLKIKNVLEDSSLGIAAFSNPTIASERHGLLALVERRLAEKLEDGHPQDQPLPSDVLECVELYDKSCLAHNAHAMELAGLTMDLSLMCNATGNRCAILNSVLMRRHRRARLSKWRPPQAGEWCDALRWLTLSQMLGEEAKVGYDNLWSPCYLLVTHRYSRIANVDWSELTSATQTVLGPDGHPCRMARSLLLKPVIDVALEMANPILEGILTSGPVRRKNYSRQLVVFAGELVKAAHTERIPFPKDQPLLRSLVDYVLSVKLENDRQNEALMNIRTDLSRWAK